MLVYRIESNVTRDGAYSTYESCERTSFYVEVVTDEGFEKQVECHQTGSVYTNHEGLSIEEARDRALIDAATWGDFLGLSVDPFKYKGVEYHPSMTFDTYETRRELRRRKEANNGV